MWPIYLNVYLFTHISYLLSDVNTVHLKPIVWKQVQNHIICKQIILCGNIGSCVETLLYNKFIKTLNE
jgi:hypothetical protein